MSTTRLAARDARQQVGQAVVALRADHEVDRRRAADDLLALGLRDAAGDRDHQLAAVARRRLLQHADAAELGIDLLGRLLADVAGVEDDEVGVVRRRGLGKAFGRKRVRHTMGIVDVHLAAERLDMDLAGSAHAGLVDFPGPDASGDCFRQRYQRRGQLAMTASAVMAARV